MAKMLNCLKSEYTNAEKRRECDGGNALLRADIDKIIADESKTNSSLRKAHPGLWEVFT